MFEKNDILHKYFEIWNEVKDLTQKDFNVLMMMNH